MRTNGGAFAPPAGPLPPEEMMQENWKPVVGFEGLYEVSDLGRVRSYGRVRKSRGHLKGQLLPPRILVTNKYRYEQVCLSKDGKKYMKDVHRLVLSAFRGECPIGCEACHGPGGKLDNRLTNLRWDTKKENIADKYRFGFYSKPQEAHV